MLSHGALSPDDLHLLLRRLALRISPLFIFADQWVERTASVQPLAMEESSIPFDFIPDPLSSPLSSPPSTQETPIEDSKQASPPSTCPNSETTMIAEPPIQRGKTFSEYIPEAHRADLIEAKVCTRHPFLVIKLSLVRLTGMFS